MTAGNCVLSHKPEADGTTKPRSAAHELLICAGHLEQLRHMLVGGTHVNRAGHTVHTTGLAQLDRELARSHDARGPVAERVKGTHDAPIPVRLAITQLRREIYDKTNSWARLICEDRDLAPWQLCDVATVCAFLEAHTEWVAAQPFVDEFQKELTDLPRRAWVAIDPAHQAKELPLAGAICLEPGCGGTLTALVRGNEAVPQDVSLRCSMDETHNLDVRRFLAFGGQREAS